MVEFLTYLWITRRIDANYLNTQKVKRRITAAEVNQIMRNRQMAVDQVWY